MAKPERLPSGRYRIRYRDPWGRRVGPDAYDAWSEDAWDGTPDHFNEAVAKAKMGGAELRIVELFIDYDEIEKHFAASSVEAEVAPSSGE